jgi:CheY-like chemotaxis protein
MDNENTSILVVDDNEENREILVHRLQKTGYQVDTANEGREALAMLRSSLVDLVLLDINMPIMDGIQALKEIRKDEILSGVPVIMLTAIEDMHITLECMRNGACGYVTKPFDMKQLETQLNNCLHSNK